MDWYGTVRYGIVWYGTLRYRMVWYGMVRYRMEWYNMIWYGMVHYGTVSYGMVRYAMFLNTHINKVISHNLTTNCIHQVQDIRYLSTDASYLCVYQR